MHRWNGGRKDRDQRSEVRGQKGKSKRRRSEVRSQRSEVRSRKGGKRQRSEVEDHPRLEVDLTDAADRVLHAARLYRAGKAHIVIVTGGVIRRSAVYAKLRRAK